MNKRGEGNALVTIILLVMVILIGFALLNPVASTTNLITEKQLTANETKNLNNCVARNVTNGGYDINVSNTNCNVTVGNWYPSGDWRRSDGQCALGSVVVKNGTSSALTLNTDYRLYASSGFVEYLNTLTTRNLTGNNTYLVYDTCNEGYLQDAGTRGISKLVITMMVLVLLITAAGVAYKQMNQ